MGKLEIYWSKTALNQRNFTFEYWNKRNRSNAYSKRLLTLINSRTTTLKTFPEIGKKVDFKNTRVLSVEHFSLFYKILDNKIIITAFWDDRRSPKDLRKYLEN